MAAGAGRGEDQEKPAGFVRVKRALAYCEKCRYVAIRGEGKKLLISVFQLFPISAFQKR